MSVAIFFYINSRLDLVILDGSCALFVSPSHTPNPLVFIQRPLQFYDYLLTGADEFNFLWKPSQITIGSVLYFIARYAAFASSVISVLPVSIQIERASA